MQAGLVSLACQQELRRLMRLCCAQAGCPSPVQCCFIDASHLVVHKQAGEQYCQREDLGAVLGSLHMQDRQQRAYELRLNTCVALRSLLA